MYRAAYQAAGWRPLAAHEIGREPGRFRPKGFERDPETGFWRAGDSADCETLADYAHTVRRLELSYIRDQRRWKKRSDGTWREGLPDLLSCQDRQGGQSHRLSREMWNRAGNEGSPPAYGEQGRLLNDDDKLLLRRILAKSPGRPRGRPPLGDRRMSDAKRQRRRRAKWQQPASAVSPQTNSLAPRSRSGRQIFNRRTNRK
jgi:hypothetical protein